MQTLETPRRSQTPSELRILSFGRALDALRSEVEADLGPSDVAHIERIQTLSNRLEILGRGLIHVSFEPTAFGLGVLVLWAHKSLELMELGHMVLHGAYDKLDGAERFRSETFYWKAPIDEASWRNAHNIRHHQYTNIEGRDPDLDFAALRLSARVPFKRMHRLQPITNVLSWLGFGIAINLHSTGMLDAYAHSGDPVQLKDRSPAAMRAARRAFVKKTARYYGREYVFFPLLAGPFFAKTLLGNVLSEVGRDLYAATTIYGGHVGAKDYPKGAHAKGRAEWYVMQAEAACNIDVPRFMSVMCGALDKQIEHHLFPRLPPNRLRQIAPRVRAICEQHGVRYRHAGFFKTLRRVVGQLRALSSPAAAPVAG
jgi:linoleoyl-CoA desaturase